MHVIVAAEDDERLDTLMHSVLVYDLAQKEHHIACDKLFATGDAEKWHALLYDEEEDNPNSIISLLKKYQARTLDELKADSEVYTPNHEEISYQSVNIGDERGHGLDVQEDLAGYFTSFLRSKEKAFTTWHDPNTFLICSNRDVSTKMRTKLFEERRLPFDLDM